MPEDWNRELIDGARVSNQLEEPSFFGAWKNGFQYVFAALKARKIVALLLLATCLVDGFDLKIPGIGIVAEVLTLYIAYETIRLVWIAKTGEVDNSTPEDLNKKIAGVEANMFGSTLLFGLFTVLTGLLLIVPGIWFATKASLAMIFVCIENKKPIESIKLSHQLTNGRLWKTMSYMILGPTLALLLTLIPVLILIVPITMIPEGVYLETASTIYGASCSAMGSLFQLSLFPPMLELYRYYKSQIQPESQIDNI